MWYVRFDNVHSSFSLNNSLGMLVSQFTLQARTQRGTKPDFHHAMVGFTPTPVRLDLTPKPVHYLQNPTDAEKMYNDCLNAMKKNYNPTKIKGLFSLSLPMSLSIHFCVLLVGFPDGRFQAMMQVASTNDGPITIILDTKTAAPAKKEKKDVDGLETTA